MMLLGKYPYPFVSCPDHAGPQRAWMVCPHCLDGTQCEVYTAPTDQDIGLAICAACAAVIESGAPPPKDVAEKIRVICGQHIRLRIEINMPTPATVH